MENNPNNNNDDRKLLTILCNEISRDGGASFVRELKNYDKQIFSLLKRASHGHTKLLAFLEYYPTIFQVDRQSLPHVVYLLSKEYCYSDAIGVGVAVEPPVIDSTHSHGTHEERKQDLTHRIICILRKEAAKDARHDRINVTGVSASWLMHQCKSQLHHYLRASGWYQQMVCNTCTNDVQGDVQLGLVGSEEWYKITALIFFNLVGDMNICDLKDDRVYLRKEEGINSIHNTIQEFAAKLIDTVNKDGGTHISLALLLHRYPELQNLLTGHDLMELKLEFKDEFQDLNVFVRNNEVFLQMTNNGAVCREGKGNGGRGRMEVDETGLFSVASSKWGNAFVNMMGHNCRAILSKDPRDTIAIDLTASVGGITLPLAKTFSRVIAVEIDSHRAKLCEKNMQTHGVATQVDVRNEDSVEMIPQLAKELSLSLSPRIVVVDPPWGGMHYKSVSERDKPIMMGRWTLVQVVERIAQHLAPTVVGIRLPVKFDTVSFFNALRDSGVSFESADTRKAGPQLFVILSVSVLPSLS